MTLEAKEGIVFRHAVTVVSDFDQGLTTLLYLHKDFAGGGVKGVLYQLFHNRGRPLNHFTGGNLVSEVFR